jgi:hypothetical protein
MEDASNESSPRSNENSSVHNTPRIKTRPASGAFSPRRGNQQMVSVIQTEANPLAATAEDDFETIVIRPENLTGARTINGTELQKMIDCLTVLE